MRQSGQEGSQGIDLFMDFGVFVHDKVFFAFDFTKSASNMKADFSEIIFRYRDIKFFAKFL